MFLIGFTTKFQYLQVFDQHLNFICLDSALFTVNMDEAYYRINNPQVKDTDIENIMNDLVSSLFSVIITLGMYLFTNDER